MIKLFRLSWLDILIASTIVTTSCSIESNFNINKNVQRYGSVIGLNEEKLDEYKKLHAAVWPEVVKMIRECNIRNYSIYLKKLDNGNYYLFSYFEYAGRDFKADLAKMAADPMTQKWWKVTDPCQKPLTNRNSGEWWASMEEVFHQD